MSSLQVMLQEQSKLLSEYAAQFGEVTDEQLIKQEILDIAIPAKVDGWAKFLKEMVPDQIKKFKERIQEYKDAIDRLEQFKEKKEAYLHNLIKMEQLEQLDGEEVRIVPDISVRRSVDPEKIEESGKVYQITLNPDEFNKYDVDGLLTNFITKEIIPNVTDLPDDHPAILSKIRPTVKILKQKKGK